MRFHVEQPLPASPAGAIDVLVDPSFLATLSELPKLGRPVVLDRREDDDRVRLRVCHRFGGELSSAVTRVVDPAKLVWVEDTTYDRGAGSATLVVVPQHYADRLWAGGTYRFTPTGREACTWVADGDVTVRFPFVGGKVERAIVAGVEDQLRRVGALLVRWLQR